MLDRRYVLSQKHRFLGNRFMPRLNAGIAESLSYKDMLLEDTTITRFYKVESALI